MSNVIETVFLFTSTSFFKISVNNTVKGLMRMERKYQSRWDSAIMAITFGVL